MVEIQRNYIEDVLQGLFHTEAMSDTPEQSRICPFCTYRGTDHPDLISHILDNHPERVKQYIESLDYILKNPVDNINVAYDWADLIGHPSASMTCAFCGQELWDDAYAKKHMNVVHKQEFEAVSEMLKEYGKNE